MARPRFGRLRRGGGGNLTLLIAQLMREQRAAEDRAINDAYQNGGLYKGKPVTDAIYLAHLKTRRDSFSTDDPLYDQWNNSVIQTEFSIGEQKIGLAFKQGKVGAGAVAAFYRGQLKNIPKDSAFYREVAGRAAEWAKSARGSARGGGRARAGAAMDSKIDLQQQVVDEYDGLETYLTDVARRAGFIAGTQTLTDASATNIERLFDMGLSVGGQPVTFEMWQGAAAKSYFAQREIIVLSEQAGRTTVTKRNALQKFIDQTLVRANAVDDRAKYEAAREAWQAEMDASNDPRKAIEATKKYIETLTAIRDGAALPGNELTNDPEFIGGIGNEIATITTGQAAGPTVTDLQSNTGEGVVTDDAERIALMFNDPEHNTGIYLDYQKLANNTGFYGQADPGGELMVIDYPANAALDPTGKMGLGKEYTQSVVNIEGEPEVVNLKGAAVLATVLLVNGSPVDPSDLAEGEMAAMLASGRATLKQTDTALGFVFTQPSGKRTYGIQTADGILFTDVNPFESLALGAEGTLTVITGDATVSGSTYQFAPTAGLNALATNAMAGTQVPGFNMTLDPILADSDVPLADLAAIFADNETVSAMVATRRETAQKNTAERRERSFGENVPGTRFAVPHLVKGMEQSPLAALLRPTVGLFGDLLRNITLPPAIMSPGGVNLRPPNAPPPPPPTPPPIGAPPPPIAGGVGGLTAPPPTLGGGVGGASAGGGVGGSSSGNFIGGGGVGATTKPKPKPRPRPGPRAL